MGCAPSIRGSRPGYCRDRADDSNSSPVARSPPKLSRLFPITRALRSGNLPTDNPESNEPPPNEQTCDYAMFGPMRLKHIKLSVLLVFPKEDSQCDAFQMAANRLKYDLFVVRSAEAAVECYRECHYDIVIIDQRQSKILDSEQVCRSMHQMKSSENSVFLAVTKKCPSDKEEPCIFTLLQAGFNKRYLENSNVGSCMNELLSLDADVHQCYKLSASMALFTALEYASDAVEIVNADHEIQYINSAYERLSGYATDEILGKNAKEFPRSDKVKPEHLDIINNHLVKDKLWEGLHYMRRKSGGSIPHHCRIVPVLGPLGKVMYYVSVKNNHELFFNQLRDGDLSGSQLANGAVQGLNRHRESLSKMQSVLVEAPINKAISIISSVQENCSNPVGQALDKALEILRSSELYSPYLSQPMKDDQMSSELVGGLLSQGLRRRFSNYDVNRSSHHSHFHNIPSSPTTLLNQVPEKIQLILETETSWHFNIIDLEKATNNRPLVFLGLKILLRFGACEVLNVSETCLMNWLQTIESKYHASNYYHNSTHATDVLHAAAFFLEQLKYKAIFDQMDEISCLISAIIHDVDHPGRTNAFLINARNELALLYNDLAVLENHHVSLAFSVTCKDDSVNIFKNLSQDDFRTMRHSIIDMVLATEMTKHFEHVSKFNNCINKVLTKPSEASPTSDQSSMDSMSDIVAHLSTDESRILIKRMLMKCADISNPCRPLDLCIIWAKRIAEEYFDQTDEEITKHLPIVMPIFSRNTCSIPKSQCSFIEYFVQGMFESWSEICDIPELMEFLKINYQYWKKEDVQESAELPEIEEEISQSEDTKEDSKDS
ncbi:high affinity cAMP-specific and IBMX-insensitive 3',5'-cyclic phosphodiesterase 8B-like isoform X2 [Octopus sinensis]|uniref:Phosphodiesterase n=1 Tax=Octopus sinensis TaxID=2607531 RepID=A0A6P7SQU9_9MOLL|nr:high affinity cAMP-specific and IBMX-insensitive 3',5'-cyclic phosphodiesterase 8B-like isoform X2 [Octopus sinensis]